MPISFCQQYYHRVVGVVCFYDPVGNEHNLFITWLEGRSHIPDGLDALGVFYNLVSGGVIP